MATINLLTPKILKWEGRTFTDDPTDRGGAVNRKLTFTNGILTSET
jgi:hypothetical protein